MIGEILGNRYEIEEKIGEGGMSIVYKARCNKLNRYVAVKVLKKEMSDNEDIVNKFKREATAIAALSDNNIVNILDVGSQDDINYIVMEYVKGKTLKELIKQFGKLNYETAITIAIQIAKALECAHKNNIIHRDVKPQNILVTEEGLIKVTDFGIAKSTSSATLTNTTTIMGSAHYFSPEQAKGTLVDNRTDLYSLGVVLYEMVTGKVPFEADSPVTIALKHIQEEVVPPKQINSKIPESLNKLIIKAMEKDPGMRYQNARDIINDLQKIKEDPNAVIDNVVENEENEHTIIMGSVNAPDNTKSVNKALEDEYYEDDEDDEYYDDDYYDEDDDDEEYDGKKKKKKSYKNLIIGVAVVVGLLLLGVGAFAISGGFSATKTVKVPDLKGMTLEEAKKAIEDAGLEYVDAGTEKSDEEEGTVIKFDPEAGKEVKKGSEVRVITSAGAVSYTHLRAH
ncbi:Stk1 family PASTA domain-containing Ser/Thr kinase, partial [Clostridium paraputrificum]|uniref:Stk1 family PASTA domain-containing Ser/Thr kinase n=1 Tax=Clostridium paraputrificum TaxID=29363 RepID=UPI002480A76F